MREHLDSVREVEQRIQHAESGLEESIELPDRPIGIPASFEDYAQLMFDLQLLAFRSDITRVFSLIMARELSGRSYSQIGVPGNHHLISHHREDAALKSQKARIDTHHMRLLNYFLERMRDTPDGDGSLLDHSAILFGSGMGDGNLHRHNDLPVLLAGKLHGKFQTGYSFDYTPDTPMANLLVTMLDHVGVPIAKLGDSTGQLLLDYERAGARTRARLTMAVFRSISVASAPVVCDSVLCCRRHGTGGRRENGNSNEVRSLLKGGADPNQAAPDGSTAVHWAVHGDNLDMLNALLAAGARPDAVTRYKITPLTLAAQNGNAALVERLLGAGANPDTASEEGQTALMTAARNGSVAAVRALLKRGAQVGLAESFRGQTALMFATGEGNTDAAKLLLEFGAKRDERLQGRLHAAALCRAQQPHRDGQVPAGTGRQRQRQNT